MLWLYACPNVTESCYSRNILNFKFKFWTWQRVTTSFFKLLIYSAEANQIDVSQMFWISRESEQAEVTMVPRLELCIDLEARRQNKMSILIHWIWCQSEIFVNAYVPYCLFVICGFVIRHLPWTLTIIKKQKRNIKHFSVCLYYVQINKLHQIYR